MIMIHMLISSLGPNAPTIDVFCNLDYRHGHFALSTCSPLPCSKSLFVQVIGTLGIFWSFSESVRSVFSYAYN